MRPKTLQEAVYYAMQEECLRAGEKDLAKESRPNSRQVYEVGGNSVQNEAPVDNGGPPRMGYDDRHENFDNMGRYNPKNSNNGRYIRNGVGFRGRPYPRYGFRGRGGMPFNGNRPSNFHPPGRVEGNSEKQPLN